MTTPDSDKAEQTPGQAGPQAAPDPFALIFAEQERHLVTLAEEAKQLDEAGQERTRKRIVGSLDRRIEQIDVQRNYVKYNLVGVAASASLLVGLIYDQKALVTESFTVGTLVTLSFVLMILALICAYGLYARFNVQEGMIRLSMMHAEALNWDGFQYVWRFVHGNPMTRGNFNIRQSSILDVMSSIAWGGGLICAILAWVVSSAFY